MPNDKDHVKFSKAMMEWFKIVLLVIIVGLLAGIVTQLDDIIEDRTMRVTETKVYHT